VIIAVPGLMVSAMDMPPLFLWLDPYLIWFFRLTDHAAVNFFIGTAVMAFLALLLGKLGSAAVLTAGRHYSLRLSDEAKKYQDLSIQALKAGDRPAYEAGNQLANEAFGKSFYLGVAQSAAFFWPVGLVLAWMQYRFLGLAFPIPVIGCSVGYIGIFIPLYIAGWWLFNLMKIRVTRVFTEYFPPAPQNQVSALPKPAQSFALKK
jgi:hypothetical protein